MEKNEMKLKCYCCHKELKESEGIWIIVSVDNTSGSVEKRLVCKSCNHLENK